MEKSDNQMDDTKIRHIGNILLDTTRPLKERFRALFTLKNIGGKIAVASISDCFADDSALLKHECAYCLGQMQDTSAIPTLVSVLRDVQENVMVRHEAGEALGAIGSSEATTALKEHSKDPSVEVAETCQLAIERIHWLEHKEQESLSTNPYASVDPAPPATETDMPSLRLTLLDEHLPMFQRYRAMFSLRNIGGSKSASVLAEGLKCNSALFRHEIAYVLGQMQETSGAAQLKVNLMDVTESPMVRHECAEALGSIGTQDCMQILKVYLNDDERVVKESCEVALDICDYAQSGELQYANTLETVQQPS